MIIRKHRSFEKSFTKRIINNNKLLKLFETKLKLFIANPDDKTLKNHRLTGARKDIFSFSLNGDLRVLYKKELNAIILIDIGSHNQVY